MPKPKTNTSSNKGSVASLPKGATALTIAGSDPSGGAGLQADLKTFQQFQVYGMSVVTLLTVQNTQSVEQVLTLEPKFVRQQLQAVLSDIPPRAIKLGALGNAEIVQAVAEELKSVKVPIVIDPVMVSKHGHALLDDQAIESYRKLLLPKAYLLTPNRLEAEKLTGMSIQSFPDVQLALHRLQKMGCKNVLLKYGRVDQEYRVYLTQEDGIAGMSLPFQTTNRTHGSGCVLAACITALLASEQTDLGTIVHYSFKEVTTGVAAGESLGKGISPVETRLIRCPF